MLWSRPPEPPDPATFAPRRLLLASEGRRFPEDVVAFVARMAQPNNAAVRVLSIARVWGTSLGFPNPNLLPNRQEWEEQRALVEAAVHALTGQGIAATGQVLGTRNATRRIVGEAVRTSAEAIVMTADPPRHWIVQDLLWSQEPYRVRRRARMPVYLVPATGASLAGGARD
jgi:hypothetical protein